MDITIMENVRIIQRTIIQCCWDRRQNVKHSLELKGIRKQRYWVYLRLLVYFLLQNSHTDLV